MSFKPLPTVFVLWVGAVLLSGCGGSSTPPQIEPPDNPAPPLNPVPSATFCESNTVDVTALSAHFSGLTQRIGSDPLAASFAEATTGVLSVGLNKSLIPVISSDQGVVVAAGQLGAGRVVVYSGQDFLSSSTRSTLLGDDRLDALLANAVEWASGKADGTTITALADSNTLANKFARTGVAVTAADVLPANGLREFRVWSADAIQDYDVLLVQVNEWGTLHLNPEDIPALRSFVQSGGGLVIAGSALHWSWWLSDSADEFPANTLLKDSGIRFDTSSIDAFNAASVTFSANTQPVQLWCDYVSARPVNATALLAMPGLFESAYDNALIDDLSLALTRLVSETPALPVSTSDSAAVASAGVAITLPPVNWPEPHPWSVALKEGYANAVAAQSTVSVSGEYTGNQPLGLYALPGQVATLTVPAAIIATGYRIQVGERLDDLRESSANTGGQWRRAPLSARFYPVDSTKISVVNAFGGALYLEVPAGANDAVEIVVENALPMPVYTHGQTTIANWTAAVTNTHAPVAILQDHGHVRLVVSSTEATSVVAPDEVMDFWTGFHQHHAELAQEPERRTFESHWLFDTQVGYGYANATDARIVYPALAERWALRTRTGDEDWWLFGHELGHQFQTSDWRGGDITEVAVNLFTMYTLNDYIYAGSATETKGATPAVVDHVALRGSSWALADLFGKLQLYRQLITELGWPSIQNTFASYYSSAYPRDTYGGFMDGFAIRYSAVNQRDISEFLTRWDYPVSESALATIRNFDYPVWLPPGW